MTSRLSGQAANRDQQFLIRRGFDRLARFYDALLFFTSGSLLSRARLAHVQRLLAAESLLILGGGSGRFLIDILERGFQGRIAFLDISGSMILKAQQKLRAWQQKQMIRSRTAPNVTWIQAPIAQVPPEQRFDAISANFYLDLFDPAELQQQINSIQNKLNPGGRLFFCDFAVRPNSSWWQRLIVWSLYRFFRISCHISAGTLPDWQTVLPPQNWTILAEASWWRGLVVSRCYTLQTGNQGGAAGTITGLDLSR
ncbi:MAG: class I SAM-dependent methyltransferase [Leptospiraceae bacterium]|nr:class I SAM-dependent methyltransferase [Leptospiraceae bacterium]